MTNVTSFPLKDKDEQELDKTISILDELYDALNKTYQAINELELRTAEVEAGFDKTLERFIEKKGLQNVPIRYIDYSVNAVDYYYKRGEK